MQNDDWAKRAHVTAGADQFISAVTDPASGIPEAMCDVERAIEALWEAMVTEGIPLEGRIGGCAASTSGQVVRLALKELQR